MTDPTEDGTTARPLPPPAFPPGEGRLRVRRAVQQGAGDLGDAYISPDDPVPPRPQGIPEDAFIVPDDPAPERDRDAPPLVTEADIDPDEVLVTGIGDDPHLDPLELLTGGDPFVLEVVETVEKLAESLKRRGKAGLHVKPGMTRFEATLRAYCVGYLAGRQAEFDQD
jgi:hypothetical protein